MPAKEVRFHESARAKMVHGLNILAVDADSPFHPCPRHDIVHAIQRAKKRGLSAA